LPALAVALAISACATDLPAAPGQPRPASGAWREEIHQVPMRDDAGETRLLYTRICRPPGDSAARVVLINHGSPPQASARPGMRPSNCDSEAVRWFLTRGFMVVLGQRRGYGLTGGSYPENTGSCSTPNFVRSGRESARDVEALIRYASALPYARRDGIVVVGQSAGGWASVAVNSQPHPGVVAIVSMAGGRGGRLVDGVIRHCGPDELVRAAATLGSTATTPMLWIYAANDSYFAPNVVRSMYAAFTEAGGKADLHLLAPFGSDGHGLFFGRGGSAIWGPLMDHYLASRPGGA